MAGNGVGETRYDTSDNDGTGVVLRLTPTTDGVFLLSVCRGRWGLVDDVPPVDYCVHRHTGGYLSVLGLLEERCTTGVGEEGNPDRGCRRQWKVLRVHLKDRCTVRTTVVCLYTSRD